MRIENSPFDNTIILDNVVNSDLNADGSFSVPNGVMTIYSSAFANCDELTSVIIPSTVVTIGHRAFVDCSHLTSVTIRHGKHPQCYSDRLKSIGNYAFAYCYWLTSITIPNSITSIGKDAFTSTRLKSKYNNYKAFSPTRTGKLKCMDKIYTVGKKSVVRGNLKLCKSGIHYCTNLFDIFNYYHGEYGKDFVVGICDVSDENVGGGLDSQRCARWIRPTKILTREEVVKIMNGDKNNEA